MIFLVSQIINHSNWAEKDWMTRDEEMMISIDFSISDHSNDEVVRKHYIYQMDAVRKTVGLTIFS